VIYEHYEPRRSPPIGYSRCPNMREAFESYIARSLAEEIDRGGGFLIAARRYRGTSDVLGARLKQFVTGMLWGCLKSHTSGLELRPPCP
jgi:hypothetical protein